MSSKADLVEFEAEEAKKTLKTKRRWITTEPIVSLYYFSVGAGWLIQPQFIYDRLATDNNLTDYDDNETNPCSDANENDTWYLLQQDVQAQSARWNLLLEFVEDIPMLTIVLISGALSDKLGRKPLLLLPAFGDIFRSVIFGLTAEFNWPLEVLLLAQFFNGLCGGSGTFDMASFAYLADVTPAKLMPKRVAIVDFCYGVSYAISALALGYLIAGVGYGMSFFVIAGVSVLNFLYIFFVMPESKARIKEVEIPAIKQMFVDAVDLVRFDTKSKRRWKIILLLVGYTFVVVAGLGKLNIQTLYLINTPFCWDSIQLGYFNFLSTVITIVCNITLVMFCVNRLNELGLIVLGNISGGIGALALAFTTTAVGVYMATVISFAYWIPMAMIRSLMSKLVTAEEKGALFSLVSLSEKTASMLGNIAINSIYAATLLFFRGTVFIVIAGINGIALVLLIMYIVKCRREGFPLDAIVQNTLDDYKVETSKYELENGTAVENSTKF